MNTRRFPVRKVTPLVLAAMVAVSVSAAAQPDPAPGPEPCLKNAWEAFNKKDYKEAINFSDECIDKFAPRAQQQQEDLIKRKVAEPPTGPVEASIKTEIFAQGLLNDVGTAYWIKGRSAEYLAKSDNAPGDYKKLATDAYAACRYSYARTWDPQGWFWSPCEDAALRVKGLK